MAIFNFKSKLTKEINEVSLPYEVGVELKSFLDICKKNLNEPDLEKIKKAFIICYEVHKENLRVSGEEYWKHNLEVAKSTILELHLDECSVISALLYNIPTFSNIYNIKIIEKEFDKTIAEIVNGIIKINTINATIELDYEHLEKFRKLLLSLSTDIRILLLKIAVRLENMRTLQFLDLEQQKRISHETMEIYVPFANRFGLINIKWLLEDLSFKFINKNAYDEIKSKLKLNRKQREDYVKLFSKPVQKSLEKDALMQEKNINFEINGRAKHIYSIFNKIRIRQKPMEELFDLFAIRIIIDSDEPLLCFYIYGLIAAIYQPIPETFKDYISAPKKNGYQSIHTALLGPQRKPVEVQIRTRKMHMQSEEGMAAHFNYKRGLLPANSVFDDANVNAWLDSVRDLFENRHSLTSTQLLDSLKKNLFLEEIHVFTPANKLLSFPKDATPLDFAFEIHSDLGTHCIAAKVNGKKVPLNHKLQSGDQVEIITSKDQLPEKSWLSMVITPKAKTGINKHLKKVKKLKIDDGKKLWHETLKNENLIINSADFKKMHQELSFRERDDFYYAIAEGELNISRTIDFLKYKIDFGFREVEQQEIRKQSKFIVETGFIINGELRDGIISEIIDIIISSDEIDIITVMVEKFHLNFEAKIRLEVPGNYETKKIVNKLLEIHGLGTVRQIK
jgi:RelA/SpoT family (p)ppGpp synthetase